MSLFSKYALPLGLLIVFGITVSSCKPETNTEKSDDEIHLNIDPYNLPKASKLSDIFESVRLIPLETNPDCLIGRTKKVFVGENHILVSDEGSPNALLHFSTDGKFLNRIGHQGKGPGEFIDIDDFTAFEDSLMVYIGMSRYNKLLAYHLDGEFVGDIGFGKTLDNAKIIGHNKMAFTGWDYELQIIDLSTHDTTKYLKIPESSRQQTPFLNGHPQTGYFYSAMGRSTIWRIDSDTVRAKIICDFGSGHFTTEEYVNWFVTGQGYPPDKLAVWGPSFYGSGSYFFNLFRHDKNDEYQSFSVLVNEKTHEAIHLNSGPESDDILFCTSTDFRTVAHSGEWVSVVGAYELVDAYEDIKNNHDFEYSQEILTQLSHTHTRLTTVFALNVSGQQEQRYT